MYYVALWRLYQPAVPYGSNPDLGIENAIKS
jgi:hypothetical protein